MRNISLLLIFTLFSNIVLAQKYKTCADGILLSKQYSTRFNYHIYTPPLKIKKWYDNMSQAKNQYPEQLVISNLSASNQDWVNYNQEHPTIKGKEHFEFVKRMDINENFFELKSKLMFSSDGVDYAIIKFYIIFEELGEPMGVWMSMKKENERWIVTSNEMLSNLAILVESFDEHKLEAIFLNVKSDNKLMNELNTKIHNQNGLLKLDLLLMEFESWEENDNKHKKQYFLDPKRLAIN